jgi:hypothetical protein
VANTRTATSTRAQASTLQAALLLAAAVATGGCGPEVTTEIRLRDASQVRQWRVADGDRRGESSVRVDDDPTGTTRPASTAGVWRESLRVSVGEERDGFYRLGSIRLGLERLHVSFEEDISRGRLTHYVPMQLETPLPNVVSIRRRFEADRFTGAAFVGIGLALGGLFGAPLLAGGVSDTLAAEMRLSSPDARGSVAAVGGTLVTVASVLLVNGVYLLLYPTHVSVEYPRPPNE